MKNTKSAFTIIEVFIVLTFLTIGTSWCVNLYKLTQCDFAPSWKGEIIHAIGLLPPAAVVTVWFDDK